NARGILARLVLNAGAAAGDAHCGVIAVHQQSAANRLVPFTPPPTGAPPVGTFSIVRRGQVAHFDHITLARSELEVTRCCRRQLIECHYPITPATFQQLPIHFENTDPIELAQGALEKDYTFGVTAFPEHLLGFGMSITPAGSPVVWFSKLANNKNQ